MHGVRGRRRRVLLGWVGSIVPFRVWLRAIVVPRDPLPACPLCLRWCSFLCPRYGVAPSRLTIVKDTQALSELQIF
jgi:hypothetical protein